jgi:hypothetical protein
MWATIVAKVAFGVVPLFCCASEGSEPEYQSMQVLCLVAAVDDNPQCEVAAQVSFVGLMTSRCL